MAEYLALQIRKGALNYDNVIAKYPNLKTKIDEYLAV